MFGRIHTSDGVARENIVTPQGGSSMFRRGRVSKESIITLDVHTTSPGQTAPATNHIQPKAPIGEPKSDLYIRANQFYLKSRLSRLRKSSSTIV
jgi:hypothetical protein